MAVLLSSCQANTQQIIEQKIPEQTYNEANALTRIAGVEAAQQFADSVYNSVELPTPVDYWRKRIYDSYLSVQRGDYGRSLEIMDSLIMYIEDPARYAYMQNQLASTYLYMGDTYSNYLFQNDQAYKSYVRARIIGLNLEDKCLISAYDARFAVVLYRRQNYLDAVNYFKKALQNYDGCDDEVAHFTREQRWIDDIAISYAKAGRYDSAMVYHKQALDFIERNRFLMEIDTSQVDLARAVIWGNMAQTLVALGRGDEAEPLFRRSIEINSGAGFDNNDANLTRLHLANLLMKGGRLDEVDSLIELVESYTKIDANPTTMARLLDTRSRYRQMKGDYQLALNDRLLQSQLQDSITRSNSLVFDAAATSEYNYILAQQEVERLSALNQIRSMWLLAGSVVVTLFSVVLILIHYAWRQSKRSMALLQDLNNQISQQKIELESTVQKLEDANQDKDRIMWVVAHDLRTPVGAIQNLMELLEGTTSPEDADEIVRHIKFATKNAQQIIGDIMLFANQDRPELAISDTDIDGLVSQTVEMMQFQAQSKTQKLRHEGLGKPMNVQVDPEKISRAVFNLIGNAVKFSPHGAEITVVSKELTNGVAISIVDRGIGVPQEIRDSIFDAFTKAKRVGTNGEKPFGLGLSIARGIIHAHGGNITLSENPDGGSIFTIELPVS